VLYAVLLCDGFLITINIPGTEFLPLDEVHACFQVRECTHTYYIFSDALEMHLIDIDMVKFRRLKM
jgi:hypothetical protein